MSTKIYFDACIFVAYFHQKHPNHEEVKKCLRVLGDAVDFEFCASYWSVNEMIKVLCREYNYQRKDADKIAKSIFETDSIGSLSLKWIDVDSASEYTFREFFEHITSHVIESKEIHLTDAIHSVIMINNKIENILTTDSDGFKGIGNFIPIDPKAVNILLRSSGK